jgi:hypothetical protein
LSCTPSRSCTLIYMPTRLRQYNELFHQSSLPLLTANTSRPSPFSDCCNVLLAVCSAVLHCLPMLRSSADSCYPLGLHSLRCARLSCAMLCVQNRTPGTRNAPFLVRCWGVDTLEVYSIYGDFTQVQTIRKCKTLHPAIRRREFSRN